MNLKEKFEKQFEDLQREGTRIQAERSEISELRTNADASSQE
jgi:hypothetical protein